MSKQYRKNYEINYYDTNKNLKCKLPSIVNFFSDIGNRQSELLGETIGALTEKKRAWVFYKYDIKIYDYPRYRDTITVETESIGFKKFYAYRGYKIINSEGAILGEALALFFLIDIEKRRPARIGKDQYDTYGEEGDIKENIKMEDVLTLEEAQYTKDFSIRYSDIDSNGHVNNCKYIEWAIESVPVEIVKDHEMRRIKVVFEKETMYGETVTILTQVINKEDKIITVHRIVNSTGIELTKLEAEWDRE